MIENVEKRARNKEGVWRGQRGSVRERKRGVRGVAPLGKKKEGVSEEQTRVFDYDSLKHISMAQGTWDNCVNNHNQIVMLQSLWIENSIVSVDEG